MLELPWRRMETATTCTAVAVSVKTFGTNDYVWG